MRIAQEQAQSDSSGIATVEHLREPPRVRITGFARSIVASHPDYVPKLKSLRRIASGLLDAGEITLERGGTVRGVVRNISDATGPVLPDGLRRKSIS